MTRYAIALRTDYYGPRTEYRLLATAETIDEAKQIEDREYKALLHPEAGLIVLPHNASSLNVVILPAAGDEDDPGAIVFERDGETLACLPE